MLRVDAALLFSTKGGDSESTDREPIFITELKTQFKLKSPGDLQLSYLWFGQRGNIKNRRVAFVAAHASSCYYKSNSITLEPKISHNPTKEPFSLDPMFFFKSQTSRSGWWLHQGCFFSLQTFSDRTLPPDSLKTLHSIFYRLSQRNAVYGISGMLRRSFFCHLRPLAKWTCAMNHVQAARFTPAQEKPGQLAALHPCGPNIQICHV